MSLLIVIGHPGVLVGCENWRALLRHCRDLKVCRGMPLPPSVDSDGVAGADAPGRDEVAASLERMARNPDDHDDGGDGGDGDDGDDAPSAHIQQTAVGFVREE